MREEIEISETSLKGIAKAKDVEKALDALSKIPDPYLIVAQRGGQQKMLANGADIVIGGGCRGGSKSFSLLMMGMNYAYESNFRGIIFRNEVKDLGDIIDTSRSVFSDEGQYIINDMRWNFNSGGWLAFDYHAGKPSEFVTRFQGRQYAYIGVDEITHMEYSKFKYLITCNRNAYHYENHFFGTCNPDPDSWVAKFISWWLCEDGYPDPEKDGKIRYCFMEGDTVDTIYWGDTREEVYEQCKDIIDRIWKPEYERYGTPEKLFIKSVSFVEAKLSDNVQLMASDPTYLANLANQSEEQRARDLNGNWKYKCSGDDLIKLKDMEAFFDNAEQTENGVHYASCDAALDGGDNLVLVHWIGHHIEDIAVCRQDSRDTVNFVSAKLDEWGVREENFTFDKQGIGNYFCGFFKRAVPFNNIEAVQEKYKNIYANLKSQAARYFVDAILDDHLSISNRLLEKKFSGKGFEKVPLAQILIKERKALRANEAAADKGFSLIKKSDMKKIVGHSPDFVEAMMMRMVFDIKRKKDRFFTINDFVEPDEDIDFSEIDDIDDEFECVSGRGSTEYF